MDVDEKTCPFCAETIKAIAIRCRFCGSDPTTAGASLPAPDITHAPTVVPAPATPAASSLETVRQYTRDWLLEKEEAHALRARHLQHFLALAETVDKKLHRAEAVPWLNTLESATTCAPPFRRG